MANKKVKMFRYKGSGEHSVFELELICEQQIELSYLKQIKIQSQQEENQKLREAMQWFVDRCDNGEVRSKRTYERFKEILNK